MDDMRKMNSDGYEEAYVNANSHEGETKEKKNQMPFHLTIVNNETGEVMQDCDFKALIGAIHRDGGNVVGGVSITRCNGVELAQVCKSTDTVVRRLFRQHPELAAIAARIDAEVQEDYETEGTENK